MKDPYFNAYLEEVCKIATEMNGLKMKKFARVSYDCLSDSLYWSDELPSFKRDDTSSAIRFILRYRTCLILEENPDEVCHEFWDKAKKEFPKWIGFSLERCSPSHKLVRLIQIGRKKV